MFPRFAFLFFVSIACALQGWAQSSGPLLARAADVRRLSKKEAEEKRPVSLRGVMVGFAHPDGTSFVIADDSSSIYCTGDAADVAKLKVGDKVAIEGITDPGGFAPFVVCRSIQISGRGTLPAPLAVHASEMFNGSLDGQLIRLQGVVRTCRPLEGDLLPASPREAPTNGLAHGPAKMADKTYLQLADGEVVLSVEANFAIDPKTMVDAVVEVDGICFNRHNNRRQFLSPLVMVPEKSNLRIMRAPDPNPWTGPAHAIEDLYTFSPAKDLRHRVLTRGVVIHYWPGHSLWIQDRGSGLLVQSSSNEGLEIGDVVEVLGFPIRGEYAPELIEGLTRKTGHVAAPVPIEIRGASEAFSQNGKLVTLQGRLAEVHPLDEGISLLIVSEGLSVRVTIRKSVENSTSKTFRIGSVVKVAGICVVAPEKEKPVSGVWIPKAFQILARSESDIVEIQPPPKLTTEKLVWIWGAIAAVLGLSILVVVALARHRLRQQNARNAMAAAEFRATLAERNRVAREIHDTLAQGLGAISLQLRLAKSASDGTDVQEHLDLACSLARSNLAEARSAIWNLRLESPNARDVAESLKIFCDGLSDEANRPRIELRVSGKTKRFSPALEENFFRIVQEAIRNALKHSGAKHIVVTLEFGDSTFLAKIYDDGIGFDIEVIRKRSVVGYGLVGIVERANASNAKIEIKRAAASGTIISLLYPAS